MIRRFEKNFCWIEFRLSAKHNKTNYECRDHLYINWTSGAYTQMQESIESCLQIGYKEVPHITSTVKMQHDPLDALAASGNCCGGPNFYGGVTKNGKSHSLDCPEVSKSDTQLDFAMEYAPRNSTAPSPYKKCTCGSASLGSDRHSSWCDSLPSGGR